MYVLTRSLIRTATLRQGIQVAQGVSIRPITVKVIPAASTIPNESSLEKNERLGRAISPHLTIYKPQLTWIMSISHRGAGIALAAYAWALGLGALVSAQDISNYVTVIEGLNLSCASLCAVKFLIAFPLTFHTFAGLRHLLWDSGRFLQMKEVYITGYITIAAALISAAVLAAL